MTTRHTQILAGSLALSLLACGGAAPVHSGYPDDQDEPWTKASTLTLNDNLQAAADGQIAFPKRARAKWYAIDLPAPGKLSATVTMEPLSTGADLGVEILDAGYNIVVEAENDNDVGQEKKIRSVPEARGGRSYIHIFALGRADVADYKLRVKYEPKPGARRVVQAADPSGDPRGAFPWTVPNLPPLAAVGSDDTPKTVRHRPPPPDEDEPPPPPTETGLRAQIIEFSRSGSGVKILLDKGSDQGVEEGWTGYVVDSSTKKSLRNGSFKIRSVKNDESEGIVNVHLDDIQKNRSVVLKPAN